MIHTHTRNAAMLLVFMLVASFFTPSQFSATQARGIVSADKRPEPQAIESHKMLTPREPRVKTRAPEPFLGVKPPAPSTLETNTTLRQPETLSISSTAEKPGDMQPAGVELGKGDPTAMAELPNLFPYQPFDWDGPVVLSTYTGSTYNSALTEGQDVYVDWSVVNGGAVDSPQNFVTCLFLDYEAFFCTDGVSIPSGFFWPHYDLLMPEKPSDGSHVITIYVDFYDEIVENNEEDNRWDAEFYWAPALTDEKPNLLPSDLDGAWSAPVVLSTMPDATTSENLVAGLPFYLKWAAINEGPGSIPEGEIFAVEVTIEDIPVFSVNWEYGLGAQNFLFHNNYPIDIDLPEGWHQVTLSIDPWNSVDEGNESDNTWSTRLYWQAPNKANLRPNTIEGWNTPVLIRSTPGLSGNQRLFADRDTYLHYSYINEGNVAANDFRVDILLDGASLNTYTDSLQPGQSGSMYDFKIPANTIEPGWHTIRLALDDPNTVSEYNEYDNGWEADFYWETNSLANLHPAQMDGWADAVVVSSIPGTHYFDAYTVGKPIYIDWALVNDGWGDIPSGSPFYTAIFVDGDFIAGWDWPNGLPTGWYLTLEDFYTILPEGWHYIEVVADSGDQVTEANEEDNRTGVWIIVEPEYGDPEIRVEPAAISVDISTAAGLTATGKTTTLHRSIEQVRPFLPQDHGFGAEVTPPTQLILPKIPLPLTAVENLPPSVDHSSKLPPIGNQGNGGSCTAWAVSYYYKSYQEGLDQGWSLTTSDHQFSPNFVWNQIQGSSECGGTWPGNAFKLLTEKGDVPLSEMPYSEDCHTAITQHHLDVAANYRAESYGQFFNMSQPPSDAAIAQMKAWLASGDLIQLSIPVTPQFASPSGPYCMVEGSSMGQDYGGHAITIVGYDDNIGGIGKQGFKIVNSWGTTWGCGGFAYLSYDWVKQYAWEAWWMRDVRTGSSTFRDFTIHNDGAGAMTVNQIDKVGQTTWLQLVLPEALPMIIEPGGSRTVQMAFNTSGLNEGKFEETVRVFSDDDDEPQTSVRVTLNYGAEESALPPAARNPQPGNNAMNQAIGSLNLLWTADPFESAVIYDVRLDTTNPPVSVVCNDQSAKSCTVKDLRPNTTYYWRVVSQTAQNSVLGPVWTFTTKDSTMYQLFLSGLYKH